MGSFVEEGKPELVVTLAIQRKLDQWAAGAQPAGHATDMATGNGGHQHQQHTGVVQQLPHLRLELLWGQAGKPANGLQRLLEAGLVVLGAFRPVQLFGLLFAHA